MTPRGVFAEHHEHACLLRVYAAELAAACDSDCREALRRLRARATPIGIPRLRRSSTNRSPGSTGPSRLP
jgi:hypothetical protein